MVELDLLSGVENLYSAQGKLSYHVLVRSVDGKVPTRQLHRTPIAVSGSGYTRKVKELIEAVIHKRVRLTSGSS